MFSAIFLQVGATLIATILIGLFVGWSGVVSALIGGGAYILPNFLFALRLTMAARAGKGSLASVATFFIGEFVKVAATIGLLAIAAKEYADLHWPSMLIGLAVALQAVVLQPLLQKNCLAIGKKS